MAFDFAGDGVWVEHNSVQNSLGEELQRHHTNQACCKAGIMSPEYLKEVFTAQRGGMCGAPNRRRAILTEVQSP